MFGSSGERWGVWSDRKELLTSWRASLATWCPASGEGSTELCKRTADDFLCNVHSSHCEILKHIKVIQNIPLLLFLLLPRQICLCHQHFWYLNRDLSSVTKRERVIQTMCCESKVTAPCLQAELSLLTWTPLNLWSIHFPCHVSTDWAKLMIISELLHQILEHSLSV